MTPTAAVRGDGQIAFSAYLVDQPGSDFDVYAMNADGSGLVNLTQSSGRDMYPDWSPDGKRIAFCSDREGSSEVYVMNADGSDQHRLTDAIKDCAVPAWSLPSWSPTGEWIAVSSAPDAPFPEGKLDIYLISSDGTQVVNLTSNPANDGGYSWSPDGKRLAFTSDRDGNEEVYVVGIGGQSPVRLTDNPARDGAAVWSPDGKSLVFLTNRDGNWEIYAMGADGSAQTRLTDNPATDVSPSWSPDGRSIAFTSDRDGNTEIYAMNPDGSGQVNLTNTPFHDYWFWWSPDGSQIAFTSCLENCQGSDSVWNTSIMNRDGTGQHTVLRAAASVNWRR